MVVTSQLERTSTITSWTHLFIADSQVEIIVSEEVVAGGLEGSSERVVAGALTGHAAVGRVAHDVGPGGAAEVEEVKGEASACSRTASRALDRPLHGERQETTLPNSDVLKGAEPPQEILVVLGYTVALAKNEKI